LAKVAGDTQGLKTNQLKRLENLYRRKLPRADPTVAWRAFGRQALHACRLGLDHPRTRAPMQWFRPPPADMATLMRSLGFGPTDRRAELPGES